ncbi:MAG: glutaredoxin family protein [Planctomycetota bacterium]
MHTALAILILAGWPALPERTGWPPLDVAVPPAAVVSAPATVTDYTTAYDAAQRDGTLVVLLTSKGCQPCATVKATLRNLLTEGELPGVAVAEVRVDTDPDFAAQVAGETVRLVPQIVVFRLNASGQLLESDRHTGLAERSQLLRILKGHQWTGH